MPEITSRRLKAHSATGRTVWAGCGRSIACCTSEHAQEPFSGSLPSSDACTQGSGRVQPKHLRLTRQRGLERLGPRVSMNPGIPETPEAVTSDRKPRPTSHTQARSATLAANAASRGSAGGSTPAISRSRLAWSTPNRTAWCTSTRTRTAVLGSTSSSYRTGSTTSSVAGRRSRMRDRSSSSRSSHTTCCTRRAFTHGQQPPAAATERSRHELLLAPVGVAAVFRAREFADQTLREVRSREVRMALMPRTRRIQ